MAKRYPHYFPLVLGWDVAGVVEEVGPAVTAFRPGDEICAYARKFCIGHGTYAEYVAVVEESAAPAPTSIDLVTAAALPLASLTAAQAIYSLEVISGETVLVHGGAGGVGSFSVQLLVDMGVTVLATGSPENSEYLRSLGAVPIDRMGDIVRQVQAVTSGGVDAVMDLAGGPDAVQTSLPLMKDGARLCSILQTPDLGEEGENRGLKARYVFVRPYGAQLGDLIAKVDAGSLGVPLHGTFPLEQAAQAHRTLQAGGVRGKIVLTIGE